MSSDILSVDIPDGCEWCYVCRRIVKAGDCMGHDPWCTEVCAACFARRVPSVAVVPCAPCKKACTGEEVIVRVPWCVVDMDVSGTAVLTESVKHGAAWACRSLNGGWHLHFPDFAPAYGERMAEILGGDRAYGSVSARRGWSGERPVKADAWMILSMQLDKLEPLAAAHAHGVRLARMLRLYPFDRRRG